jgi:hypothetical protein
MCDGLDESLLVSVPRGDRMESSSQRMGCLSDGVVEASASRAVLAPQPSPAARAGAFPKPRAAFVTQVLACREGEPSYRARRRAEPGFASRAYDALRGAELRVGLDRVL